MPAPGFPVIKVLLCFSRIATTKKRISELRLLWMLQQGEAGGSALYYLRAASTASKSGCSEMSFTYSTYFTRSSGPITKTALAVNLSSGPSAIRTP